MIQAWRKLVADPAGRWIFWFLTLGNGVTGIIAVYLFERATHGGWVQRLLTGIVALAPVPAVYAFEIWLAAAILGAWRSRGGG